MFFRCSAVLLLFAAPSLAFDRDAAYALLTQRAAEHRARFFIYQDGDSGANHGFASGFFGQWQKIEVDAACIDDPSAANGCSSDANRLDRTRGSVMRMSFGALTSSQFAGVNVEEPENWGAQQRGNGYDLRGATTLVLDVRSPTPGGIKVQFGVGGRTTAFMTIAQSASWTTINIPLSSLGPPAPDLANVHILFTVVTNGTNAPGGGTILLDDIRLSPVPASRSTALGLPVATQTFGVVPVQEKAAGRVPIPPDQANRNAATIYETALTMLALLDRGRSEDREVARMMADTLVYALDHDNPALAIPASQNGRGLHSGYEAGDIALMNDQGGGGRAGDVRFAGFSAGSTLCGPSRYCPILDDATGGNAALVILALLAAHRELGETRSLDAARAIGTWIHDKLRDPAADGFGGYFLGYPGGAVQKTEVIRTKVTENNAAIFAALSQLAAVESTRPSSVGAAEWTRRAAIAGDFVIRMFNAADGRFHAGTVPRDTPGSNGVNADGPVKGDDVVNTFDFLDANTFAVLALADSPAYRAAIDWRRPMQWIARQERTVATDGGSLSGFSIVPKAFGGPEGIAWEFTGQTVAAMRLADCASGDRTFAPAIENLLAQIAQAQTRAPFGDGRGVVAATLAGGESVPPREQCLSTPFQCIPQRVGLAATVWSIFADAALNPLSPNDTWKICPARPRRRSARR